MSFGNIPLFLQKQIKFEDYKIDTLKTKLKEYNLCITGNVGVGKSTTLEFIKIILNLNNINTKLFPEYLQNETGKIMFEFVNTGRISKIVFQNYILDNWVQLYQDNKHTSSNYLRINLYERYPEDCVKCFGKISLDQTDYDYLLKRYNKFKKEYDFIEYSSSEIEDIENDKLDETLHKIIDIINEDLKNNIKNRVIKLTLEDSLNEERIKQRGRDNETKELNYDIIKYYDDLK